ncbi:MAG: enoyl-CoA hydratase [Dehalococcoidia bacterium]|nr:MAG: enoyl-CoA hydratase [Dehalococcoidia bacterium]UCG83037.1 MAG: enoyl-CoA hydratase [Dehalococcoidia bacterium]
MENEYITYTVREGIATMTFNRPEKLNAFTPSMYNRMVEIFEEVAGDDEVRVFIITGTGRAFCVGADVKTLEQGFDRKPEDIPKEMKDAKDRLLTVLLRRINKPVITAINGITAGGGFEIACASDIRIASDKATFSTVFVRRGLMPTLGGTYFLPRLMGVDKACLIIWTGDLVDAKEAERIGLVTSVVPHDELQEAAQELASKIVKGAPLAITKSKEAIYKGLDMDFDSAMDDVMQAVGVLTQTEDHQEAVRAFLEKREPVFKGR